MILSTTVDGRTSYFKPKDPVAFRAWTESLAATHLEIREDEDPDAGTLYALIYHVESSVEIEEAGEEQGEEQMEEEEEEGDEPSELYADESGWIAGLSKHLATNWVAVVQEISKVEKDGALYAVGGGSAAINSKQQGEIIALGDLYLLDDRGAPYAKNFGKYVTFCED